MAKLGSKKKPIRVRIQSEDRITEIAAVCEKRGWQFIANIAPDEPEDTVEFDYMLNPRAFKKEPRLKHTTDQTVRKVEPQVARNAPCPCGSGKKYKKCCMGKE